MALKVPHCPSALKLGASSVARAFLPRMERKRKVILSPSGSEVDFGEQDYKEFETYQEQAILDHMLDIEEEYLPQALPTNTNTTFDALSRLKLFDWLTEIASKLCMQRTTLYTAFNFVDRYLALVPAVPRERLQLVGVTALYLAGKLEETVEGTAQLDAKKAVALTINSYRVAELLVVERAMLRRLQWRMSPPHAMAFTAFYLRRLCEHDGSGDVFPEMLVCTMQLVHACVLHGAAGHERPSRLAACGLLAVFPHLRDQFAPALDLDPQLLEHSECFAWVTLVRGAAPRVRAHHQKNPALFAFHLLQDYCPSLAPALKALLHDALRQHRRLAAAPPPPEWSPVRKPRSSRLVELAQLQLLDLEPEEPEPEPEEEEEEPPFEEDELMGSEAD